MTITTHKLYTQDFVKANEWAAGVIPAHLDAEELIANAWNNCADVEDVIECFRATVEMYIDQNCSSF